MIVRTFLLISDDPDDHIEFSEALYEISDDTVLVTVTDLQKAVGLLALKKCIPEYVFLNLSISGFNPDMFFTTLEDPDLQRVNVIAFGESPDLADFHSSRITAILGTNLSYSELKRFLEKVVKPGE